MVKSLRTAVLSLIAILAVSGLSLSADEHRLDPSALPKAAKTFIANYYPGTKIKKCEIDETTQAYEIKLTDGTEIEFNTLGACVDISAPGKKVISSNLAKALLPESASKTLAEKNLLHCVKEIEYSGQGYKVEVRHKSIDDIYFNTIGQLGRITRHD
jgi:hypothetical protein